MESVREGIEKMFSSHPKKKGEEIALALLAQEEFHRSNNSSDGAEDGNKIVNTEDFIRKQQLIIQALKESISCLKIELFRYFLFSLFFSILIEDLS